MSWPAGSVSSRERGGLGEAAAAALVGAGMLSLLAFPLLALGRLRPGRARARTAGEL